MAHAPEQINSLDIAAIQMLDAFLTQYIETHGNRERVFFVKRRIVKVGQILREVLESERDLSFPRLEYLRKCSTCPKSTPINN